MLKHLIICRTKQWILIAFSFLTICNYIHAQGREILYIKCASSELQKVAESIQDVTTTKVPYERLQMPEKYFVRIAPKRFVIDSNKQVIPNALLGTKPYVFCTTPESILGKTIMEIYLDIGYEAEDILRWQVNTEMVAIVFSYPENVSVSKELHGNLPKNWKECIYIPTWDNMFSLFAKLAENAEIQPLQKGEFAPKNLFFKSEQEKNFALGFPEESKKRIKITKYSTIQAEGGADWKYRNFLERKLSLMEHFRGNGRTQNELIDPDFIGSGIPEFVGPNSIITEFPEFAIIYLGKLHVAESY